jgi:hypothetical protein
MRHNQSRTGKKRRGIAAVSIPSPASSFYDMSIRTVRIAALLRAWMAKTVATLPTTAAVSMPEWCSIHVHAIRQRLNEKRTGREEDCRRSLVRPLQYQY